MERDKESNEKEKVGACPCHTTPKEEKWDEKRWKQHWADRRKGHKDMLERLHKEARR